ncbi:MAG: hypothetical protein ABUK01_06125 [Leptospirales bacterium]
MNTNKIRNLSLSLLGLVFISGIIGLYGEGEEKPKITLGKKVEGCQRFETIRISGNDYILTKSYNYKPLVYNYKEGKLLTLPTIEQIDGIAKPINITSSGAQRQADYSGAKLRGEHFSYYQKNPVYYDGENSVAGILLNKKGYEKVSEPKCSCEDTAKFIEKYQRYYCYTCKEYVAEKTYIEESFTQYYVHIDLKTKKVLWQAKLGNEDKYLGMLGVDPQREYLYYTTQLYISSKEVKSSGKTELRRLNLKTHKVELVTKISFPIREKGKVPPSYGTHYYISPDFKFAIFWEYDELHDIKNRKGYLNAPGAQAVAVDLKNNTQFSFDYTPVAYGRFYNEETGEFFVENYQTGEFFKVDMAEKKLKLIKNLGKGHFTFVLSPKKKFVYAFSKSIIDVYSWPSMDRVEQIKYDSLFPGVNILLVVEKMFVSSNGEFALMGIFKNDGAKWSSTDLDGGFQILHFGG